MTFVYLPFDMFLKPVAEDREVWFGVALSGWWAKATEPIHWAIYALGAWGLWGRGWPGGAAAAAIFMLPTIALWRAKPLFRGTFGGSAR
ncbi:MAG TPA: hypothetical protein VH583_17840 [Vicinamibacterales bacterium]|jgi:hypothetical protein